MTSTVAELLPISDTIAPGDAAGIAQTIADCFHDGTPVYPVGGGTSLDYGLPAKLPGIGLSLGGLTQIVDYPARDMTITVEAGITMQALAETLAAAGQRFPVDVPNAGQATLGGVVATNWNGPRRFGQGTVRDYVLGVQAVDGRGVGFKGGGRVVKNVAGYDFCKLLTGSLGTLGVITQLTLKLKPIPERLAWLVCRPHSLEDADRLVGELMNSQTSPAAVELLGGPAWEDDAAVTAKVATRQLALAVALEGTESEVIWMLDRLATEWRQLGVAAPLRLEGDVAHSFMLRLAEFAATGDSPLVLKASLVSSGVAPFIAAARQLDPHCSVQSHAGNGIVIIRLSEFPAVGLAKTVVGQLQATAAAYHGHVVVLSNPGRGEITHQSVWGATDAPFNLMTAVKREFDPKNILNPGRFVYV